MRVEHGRDNAGRRLSGNSDHDIVGEPEHTLTHTHIRYIRASGLRLCLENHVSREREDYPELDLSHELSNPGSFYFAIYIEKFVRTLGSAIIYSWSQGLA